MSSDHAAIQALFDNASGDLAIGELDAAAEKYRRCVELDPAFFDGWHALGMVLMKLGRPDEAIEVGLKAVDLRPNDELAWSSLSLFYVRAGRIKDAESAGAKARILSWGGRIDTTPGTGGAEMRDPRDTETGGESAKDG